MTQCTAANKCTPFTYCARQTNATPSVCDTSSTTCSGTACAAGPDIRNPQTCSKCADQCSMTTTASACNGMASCAWGSFCFDNTPTPSYPCSGMDKASCTGDAAGCIWFAITETVCGASMSRSICTLCNDTVVSSMVGPLSRMVGQTCTYAKGTGFAMGASVRLNEFGMGAVGTGSCVAIPAGSGAAADQATIAATLAAQMIIGAGTTGTCAATPSGSSMLTPSLAILGLVAFFTRF